jgi:hypothetical protein
VTGTSSGIGAAFARTRAAQHCNLILVARRQSRLACLAGDLQRRFGVDAEVVVADLATLKGVEQVIRRLDEHGRVDWLINAAGFGLPGRFAEVPLEHILPIIELHVLASVRLTRAVLPRMSKHGAGRIVNVASIGAFLPRPGDATYCATKAYMVRLDRRRHGHHHRGSGRDPQRRPGPAGPSQGGPRRHDGHLHRRPQQLRGPLPRAGLRAAGQQPPAVPAGLDRHCHRLMKARNRPDLRDLRRGW